MSEYGTYLVTGKSSYRGHPQGETFTARLDRPAERRAIARGSLQLLERITPDLEPGRLTLPVGWSPDPPRDGGTSKKGRDE